MAVRLPDQPHDARARTESAPTIRAEMIHARLVAGHDRVRGEIKRNGHYTSKAGVVGTGAPIGASRPRAYEDGVLPELRRPCAPRPQLS